jgi:hypothetical protein
MNTRHLRTTYWSEWEVGPKAEPARTTSQASADPTIVSLTTAEFQRLLEIESAAQAALMAMSRVQSHEKNFSDAAEALGIALNTPVFGG